MIFFLFMWANLWIAIEKSTLRASELRQMDTFCSSNGFETDRWILLLKWFYLLITNFKGMLSPASQCGRTYASGGIIRST